MRHLGRFTWTLAFVLALNGNLGAQTAVPNPVAVEQPWARATPKGAKTAAAYMILTNNSRSAEKLLSATSPMADKIQFHEETEENGVARMRELRGIEIAPGTKIAFKPGSMHMMMVGLKQPLKQGETFPLTLHFEHAGEIEISVPVSKVGAMGQHDMNMMPGTDHPMKK